MSEGIPVLKPFHVRQQNNSDLWAHCDLRQQNYRMFIKWYNHIECINLFIKFSFNKNFFEHFLEYNQYLFLFFNNSLVRWNLHAIKVSLLKYIIQWFLVVSKELCSYHNYLIPGHFHHPPKKQEPINIYSLTSFPSLLIPNSLCSLYGYLFIIYTLCKLSHTMWLFVFGFSHLAQYFQGSSALWEMCFTFRFEPDWGRRNAVVYISV